MQAFEASFKMEERKVRLQHGASVTLTGRGATTMRAPKAGCLRIEKGAAWITVTPTDERTQSEDLVLLAGECLKLARGQEFVMESWVPAKARRPSRYVSVLWEGASSASPAPHSVVAMPR
jgi:hypothetical protein